MKFHSKARKFCAVIRPSGYHIVDGGRVHRPGIRAQFDNWRLDTEAVDWDPDPQENKRIREMVEDELLHARRFTRSRGSDYWLSDDQQSEKKARDDEKAGVSDYQCPWCEFPGKSDTSLTQHVRMKHPDKMEKFAEEAAQSAAARMAATG